MPCVGRNVQQRQTAVEPLFGNQQYGGKMIRLFYGRAGAGVARITLSFGNKTVNVLLSGRYFLAEFPGPANQLPSRFLSYTADGTILEQHPFMRPTNVGPPAQQPQPVAEPHEMATINARGGSEHVTLLVGRPVQGFRTEVQSTLTELQACTHLNDMLRCLAEVPALSAAITANG